MEKTKFELNADEAALIFKKDMSIEIIIPKLGDTETVDFEDNQNMFVAMAIAASADNKAFRDIVGAKLNEMLSSEPGEGCGPDCGGCSTGCVPEADIIEPEDCPPGDAS